MTETPDLAPLPTPPVTTLGAVKGRLGLGLTDTREDAAIAEVLEPVDVMVRRLPIAYGARGMEAWPADIAYGATLLAARLHRRRNTPDGVVSFSDQGPVYVQRNDPDIAQLLQLGDYSPPSVG